MTGDGRAACVIGITGPLQATEADDANSAARHARPIMTGAVSCVGRQRQSGHIDRGRAPGYGIGKKVR